MKLWSMWYQGRNEAPELCQRVFKLWERFNPDLELHVAERKEVLDRLAGTGVALDDLGLTKVANLFRLHVLATEGGIWVDATAMPTRPLSEWFFGKCDTTGFFARRDPQPDCIVSNWMIYSEAGHPLCMAWRDWMFEHYQIPRKHMKRLRHRNCRSIAELLELRAAQRAPDKLWFVDRERGFANRFSPYFTMHYTFEEMIRTDPALAEEWSRVPALPAGHTTLIGGARGAIKNLGWKRVAPWIDHYLDLSPVHKLSYKHSDFGPLLDIVERRLIAFENDRRGQTLVCDRP